MKLFLLLSAGGVLLAPLPARAEIHIGDPYVRAALEDYAKFAGKPAADSQEPSKTAPSASLALEAPKVTAGTLAVDLKKKSR